MKVENLGYSERIKEIRHHFKMNQAEFASFANVLRSAVSEFETGKREPTREFIETLSNLGISIDWFMSGDGSMLRPEKWRFGENNILEKARKMASTETPLVEDLRDLIEKTMEPKLEKLESRMESRLQALEGRLEKPGPAGEGFTAEAGPGYGDEEEEEESEDLLYVHDMAAGPPTPMSEDRSMYVRVPRRYLKSGERYYTASIRGTSMTAAKIFDGDIALIRRTGTPRDGAIQAVRYGDAVTLKRLRETGGEGWELHYMDGSGRVIACDSDGYETLGEFITILPKGAAPRER
jgi:SOS-response transcriptional repressor LexA/DNA-binding XRE family transcriptional regulator